MNEQEELGIFTSFAARNEQEHSDKKRKQNRRKKRGKR
jgi:hypothetical protein